MPSKQNQDEDWQYETPEEQDVISKNSLVLLCNSKVEAVPLNCPSSPFAGSSWPWGLTFHTTLWSPSPSPPPSSGVYSREGAA